MLREKTVNVLQPTSMEVRHQPQASPYLSFPGCFSTNYVRQKFNVLGCGSRHRHAILW